ncbi:aminotransferase class III-fold pyridoxal phosphate-dependent enzyme [bacterium]|nr:aminotransferase class III-fold pyridoxal phosphate-dependent enzyme [bacterium]
MATEPSHVDEIETRAAATIAAPVEKLRTFDKNIETFVKATRLIPQGIYGHQSPALMVPGSFPYYAAWGKGARYTDIDGNTFIDYMCAYGPMVIGYANDEVNAAAIEALQEGDCFNHPGPRMLKLAERLTTLVPFAGWSVFAKNGSDLTTWATLVAREHTDRSKIAMVRGTYHGAHAWCTPGHGGVIPEDRSNMLFFDWNRADQLADLFKTQGGQIAAVIMTPYHHPAFGESVLPAPGFWREVRELCDKNGALLILDDVRAGWRLSIHGSHDFFGFVPDIAVYCKAIGNGFPLSAAVGKPELKAAASRVFLTGSYWNGSMCMAAGLKTLEILERDAGIAAMFAMGERLGKGLSELGDRYGYPMKLTGPASMPYLVLEDDADLYKVQRFCAEATRRGSYLHPHHNWFLSAVHTEADIDETLNHGESALKAMQAG